MSKTDYAENTLAYVGLFTAAPSDAGGGTEVTGGSYVRTATDAADWTDAADGSCENALPVTFVTPSASLGHRDPLGPLRCGHRMATFCAGLRWPRRSPQFTATETGKSITVRAAGPIHSRVIIDETADTITFLDTFIGLTTTFALDPETGEAIGDPLSEEVTFLQPAFSVTVPHSARGPPYTTSAVVLASVLTRGRISASLTRKSVRSQRQEKGVEQAPGLPFCFGVPPLFPAALRQA